MNKSKLSKIALYSFFVVSIANLITQIIEIEWLDMVTKPLLMITLLIYYLTSREGKLNKLSNLILGAVVFSWFGDILLMLQGRFDYLFIFGLGAFLIAHVFYVFAYIAAKHESGQESAASFIRMRMVFLLFVGMALMYMLYPNLGELLIPVTLYTIVIISMGISALLRRGKTTDKSFIMVYSGALLFIMSDAMIGINKFMSPLVQANLLIMATYISAQFLIIKGILAHEQEFSSEDLTVS